MCLNIEERPLILNVSAPKNTFTLKNIEHVLSLREFFYLKQEKKDPP